jgi:hypothetical protein
MDQQNNTATLFSLIETEVNAKAMETLDWSVQFKQTWTEGANKCLPHILHNVLTQGQM